MEQKFCGNCGSPIGEDVKFCTNCGARNIFWDQGLGENRADISGMDQPFKDDTFGGDSVRDSQQPHFNEDMYTGYNSGGPQYENDRNWNGNYGDPRNNTPYGAPPFGYGAPNGGMPPYSAPVQENNAPGAQMNLGLFIYSIINMVVGFCCCVGTLVGIAAMLFTVFAPRTQSKHQTKTYNTVALILNIVSTVLTVIILVAVLLTGGVEDPDQGAQVAALLFRR